MSGARRPPPWVNLKSRERLSRCWKPSGIKKTKCEPKPPDRWEKSTIRGQSKWIKALQDEKEEVRRTAAIALGKIKDPAVEALIASLKDEKSASVRRRAAVALGEIQDPQAEAFLLAAFKKGNLEAVAGAHAFFIRRGEPGTETQLIKALQEFGYIRMAEKLSGAAINSWPRRVGIG